MLLIPFCICLLLLLIMLFFDLRTSRLLRRGMQTRATRAVLSLWPLQVFLHLVILYVVASSPLFHHKVAQIKMSLPINPRSMSPA
jgi:hypothetical protein